MSEIKLNREQKRINKTGYNFCVTSGLRATSYFSTFQEAYNFFKDVRATVVRHNNACESFGNYYADSCAYLYVWEEEKKVSFLFDGQQVDGNCKYLLNISVLN